MECKEAPWPTNREFLVNFDRKTTELHIPVNGSLELTSRCNLNCVHCYLGPHPVAEFKGRKEMSTERVLSVLDEITEAGCLNLLMTGGEPLLRKDFSEIYGHAKRNGLLVTVFSNGTLINGDIASLFADLPPQAVEISLYGATETTYEKVTGVPGSQRRCLEGIRLLMDAGVTVKLKTLLTTLSRHEFLEIKEIARRLGVEFRFDAALFPRFNGDRSPVDLRVPPEEVVDTEFLDAETCQQWKDFFQRAKNISMPDKLYACGAGMNSFHIDAYGNLKPCLMITSLVYALEKGDFGAGWKDVVALISRKKPGRGLTCRNCEKLPFCGYCPAFFALESGKEDVCSDYLCRIGAYRLARIT